MDTTQINREAPGKTDSPKKQSQPRKPQEQPRQTRKAPPERPRQAQPRKQPQPRPEQTQPRQERKAPPERPQKQVQPRQERRPQEQPQKQTQPRKPREQPRQAQPQRRAAQETQGKPAAAPVGAAVREGKQADRRRAKAQEQTDLSSGRKRAYGNSKPKKKSALARMTQSVTAAARKSRERSQARQERKPRSSAPAVIYTEPKAFNRSRLMMQLLIVAAVVAALVLGVSVFFKVGQITVTGASVYTPWAVLEASGIEEGDSLLTFSRPRAGAQIKANLPYVKNVRFGIKLPDTVNIIIEEEDVVYAVKDSAGTWWLINSQGRVVEQAAGRATNYTQILGLTLENPTKNTQAVATEAVSIADDPTGPTVAPVTTTGAQRLQTALQIVSALEDNDIVGEAASVDVSRLEDIIVWYGTRYQANLGDSTRIDYKIACMKDVIQQLSEYQSGILDISFTIWPDKVIYTPFG